MRIRDIFTEKRDIIAPLDLTNIVSYTLSLSKEKIFINLDREVEKEEALHIDKLIGERKKGKPLAYIVKSKEFFSEVFHVDQHVLVPRPETEILVEEALRIIENKPGTVRVMDMGTGSGAIGIILAKKTLCETFCVDISLDALRVAKRNAKQLGTKNNINFVCSNLFEGIKEDRRFDLILANLPYISQQEWNDLAEDVKAFEPRIALYGGEEGVEVYARFVAGLPYYLKKNGHVLCEIGSNLQGRKVRNMLESLGFKTTLKTDLSGRERVIEGA
ncbi:MAG: peptide chain release factor N(5)-glutamine methyltransferase [Proteobacteria bacterium]|nr:peptide chain release factor N(5)-glutamine methyltransferase [Pseudomonadota bacterium]